MKPLNIIDQISAFIAWLIAAAIVAGLLIKLISILISWANRPPPEPKHFLPTPPGVAVPADGHDDEENDP